jgi:predicted transcriptional regulator
MAVSVKLDGELKDRLQQLATSRRRSPHWMMREAIQQYVEREESRASFLQEAQASWIEYQTTGKHLTGDEVQAWLRTWGTETETEVPDCHD